MVTHRPPGIQRSLSELSSQIKNVSPVKRRRRDKTEKRENKFEPWYMKYAPKSSNEVAVHKKKLEDVSRLFTSMLSGRDQTRIMLLTGPSGSSKSTLVSQLAKELLPRYRIGSSNARESQSSERCEDIVEYTQLGNFQDFLDEAKYRTGRNLSMVLVEDLPNVFHTDTRIAFQKALLKWLYSPEELLPPLVICLTECELENESSNGYGVDYSFTAESVLGKELLSHPKLTRIKFNPINTTLMKKHLKNVCMANRAFMSQRGRWPQKDLVVQQLASMTGDIRSAIANLQYWATSSGDVPFTTREQSLTYFHIIGKALYGSHACSDHEMVNSLMLNSKSHLSNDNFRLGLPKNYWLVNGGNFGIRTAFSVIDGLSQSDLAGPLLESLEFAVRKVRHEFNTVDKTHASHSKPMFPRDWRIRQRQREFEVHCEDYTNVEFYKYNNSCSKKDLCLLLGYYGPLIRAKRNYKRNSLKHYASNLPPKAQENIMDQNNDITVVDPSIDVLERIGGAINAVDGVQDVVCTEDREKLTKHSLEHLKQLRDGKLKKLEMFQVIEEPEADAEVLQDLIEDTDVEEDDDSLYELLSQKRTTVNESLSDSDLEGL